MPLVLLLGGARSGKSRLAVELALGTGAEVTFVATAEARDTEMEERIAAHRRDRPEGWRVVEEPYALEAVLRKIEPAQTVIVDCLSIWAANALERGDLPEKLLGDAERTADFAAGRACLTIAVTNEVGLGVVPATPLGRAYRDALGSVNQAWSKAAASASLVVAGRVLGLAGAEALLSSVSSVVRSSA
jgi:adenosyl cobinamide kinase/adenosyl cobinamide phosphate guanylyltransferase